MKFQCRIIAVVLFPSLYYTFWGCTPRNCCSKEVKIKTTAIILHQNFIFLIFALVFKAKYLSKIYPSQKDQLCVKMQGRQSRPSNLLDVYPFQERYILVKDFAIKTQARIKKKKVQCKTIAVVLFPSLYCNHQVLNRNMHKNLQEICKIYKIE